MEDIINRVKQIVLDPKSTWEIIKTEETSVKDLLLKFVLPLSLIPALASLIGYGFIGLNTGIYGNMSSIECGASHAINIFVTTFIGILFSAWVISLLAPKFGTILSMDKAVKLVAYSYAPSLLAGVFYLIPALSVLAVIGGIYSLYVLYLGFKPITNVNEEHKSNYFLISILSTIIVFVFITVVIGIILTTFGLSANI